MMAIGRRLLLHGEIEEQVGTPGEEREESVIVPSQIWKPNNKQYCRSNGKQHDSNTGERREQHRYQDTGSAAGQNWG